MSTIKVNSVETTDDTKDMKFVTNSTEAMRIDSNGHLVVGATSHIGATINTFTKTGEWGLAIRDIVNNQALVFFQNPSEITVGTITHDGTSTSYNTSSDYRLKTDAQPMTGASARVQALNPVNFEWIANGSRTDGFLAHEAQAVVPECASGTKDAVDENGNPEYQGIDQSKLVPLLTAALQEALTRIEALESKA